MGGSFFWPHKMPRDPRGGTHFLILQEVFGWGVDTEPWGGWATYRNLRDPGREMRTLGGNPGLTRRPERWEWSAGQIWEPWRRHTSQSLVTGSMRSWSETGFGRVNALLVAPYHARNCWLPTLTTWEHLLGGGPGLLALWIQFMGGDKSRGLKLHLRLIFLNKNVKFILASVIGFCSTSLTTI